MDNTPAATMADIIPVEERRRRNALLTSLSEQKRMTFYNQHLGQSRPILFEKSKTSGKMSGFTDNYIKIETKWKEESLNFIENRSLIRINKAGWWNVEKNLLFDL